MLRELEKTAGISPADKSKLNKAGPMPERPILRQLARLSNGRDAFRFGVFGRLVRWCLRSRALVRFRSFTND